MIFLVIHFNLGNTERKLFLGFLPLFTGDHSDFDIYWYYQVGTTISLALVINMGAIHMPEFALSGFQLIQRCRDRDYFVSLREDNLEDP
jgi:hypothetical protein